jgi:hypothetical protein
MELFKNVHHPNHQIDVLIKIYIVNSPKEEY